jgi:hypothetical protein
MQLFCIPKLISLLNNPLFEINQFLFKKPFLAACFSQLVFAKLHAKPFCQELHILCLNSMS